MPMRFLPRFDRANWCGPDIEGNGECEGLSFAVQWLGLIIEFNFGRVTEMPEKAR